MPLSRQYFNYFLTIMSIFQSSLCGREEEIIEACLGSPVKQMLLRKIFWTESDLFVLIIWNFLYYPDIDWIFNLSSVLANLLGYTSRAPECVALTFHKQSPRGVLWKCILINFEKFIEKTCAKVSFLIKFIKKLYYRRLEILQNF